MWYAASLFFKSYHDPPDKGGSIWEESIVLIEAIDLSEARDFAERLGRAKVVSFQAIAGNTVTWRFERLGPICSIEEGLTHGVELFSRFMSESEVESINRRFEEKNDS